MEFKHRDIIIQFNLNVYWEAFGALQKAWRSILCSLQFYDLSPCSVTGFPQSVPYNISISVFSRNIAFRNGWENLQTS